MVYFFQLAFVLLMHAVLAVRHSGGAKTRHHTLPATCAIAFNLRVQQCTTWRIPIRAYMARIATNQFPCKLTSFMECSPINLYSSIHHVANIYPAVRRVTPIVTVYCASLVIDRDLLLLVIHFFT